MARKFVVYHLEERGDAESGPMGVAEVSDAVCDTADEATAWLAKHGNRYSQVMEVADYPDEPDYPFDEHPVYGSYDMDLESEYKKE